MLSCAWTQTANLTRLGGALLLSNNAYEYDRQLADGIGPRLTGSANYDRAADWAVAQFKALGLSRVGRESWTIPAAWEPDGPATARMITPHEQALHLISEGWSPSTGQDGVRGPVYYVNDVRPEAVRSAAARIANAIVLVDEASLAPGFAQGEGTLYDGLRMIGEEGARGILFGVGTSNGAANMFGDTGLTGTVANIPAGNLGLEDTLLLERLLRAGRVEVEFSFQNRIRRNVPVDNVVAEIPGSDASGEFVVIGAHLDSWQPGTGAQDDGTGVAAVIAIARAVRELGLKPRRSMRFVLFGGEEEGMLGSIQYARRHAAELTRCAGVFITDNGAVAPDGWYTLGRADDDEALTTLAPLLNGLGAGERSHEGRFAFSADDAAFLVRGVPTFMLKAPMTNYLRIHHQPGDTFDKVNERDLNLG
ncbi:MAG TPA: M20/M25/M40 family metallo-hydrolase, partial [Terriglobales bacterium]